MAGIVIDSSATSTLGQAREHARRQAGTSSSGPTVPSSAASDLPVGVRPDQVTWDEIVPLGGYATRLLTRGTVLRLSDRDGDACVQLLAFVRQRPWERLNVVDTVKVQWQAYLGPGSVLLSDMGRVLLTFTDDTSARHDCLCGGSSGRRNQARYGRSEVGTPTASSRQLLGLGAAKHGLGRVDLGPPVNLFKGARVAEDGAISFEGAARPGCSADLRAELDVLVLLAVTPHPLDDRPEPTGTPVRATAWRTDPKADDPVRSSTPERQRAFLNTDELLLQATP